MSDKTETVKIKYNIDEIFACMEPNSVISKDLEPFCNDLIRNNNKMTLLSELSKPMADITKLHTQGINPNDIILRNNIRENLNKLNNKNYTDVLKDITSLNYSEDKHFALLSTELIYKSMADVMGSKGVESNKPGQKTLSELCVEIASEMSQFFIEKDNKITRFKTILSRVCQGNFVDLTNKNESMDHNNPRRLSNYKGFMNMMGLMYAHNLFPIEIVLLSFQKIVNLITKSNLSQEESDNYYSGYERLMNRVLSYYEKLPIAEQQISSPFNKIKSKLEIFNNAINNSCDNQKEKQNKPLRQYSLIVHKQLIVRFNALCENDSLQTVNTSTSQ